MQSLTHATRNGSSSEITSSDEEPDWYASEMTQAQKINETANTTYLSRQQLLEQNQALRGENQVLRTENGDLRVQLNAERIHNEEVVLENTRLTQRVDECVERIEGYQEDLAAHDNVMAATRSVDRWKIAYRAGAIALNVLGIVGAIVIAVLILL